MSLNLLDRIGEINPQLFRELKGRLKVRNVAIALATSLLGQLLFVLYWLEQLPGKDTFIDSPYCRLRNTYEASQLPFEQLQEQYRQLQADFSRYSGPKHFDPEKVQQLKASIQAVKGEIEALPESPSWSHCPPDAIDYQLWWHDHYPVIFALFSVILMFALLVAGTYMLISDLAREERRGTLNFIRLSPQSTQTVLSGKLLGVPILLYLAAALSIPLHLWLGLSAQIPLVEIFSFWTVLVGSCAFFYSAALLFGLVSSWLGGFQAWLGSGTVLCFLTVVNNEQIYHNPFNWLHLFCPSVVLPYLVNRTGSEYTGFPFSHTRIQEWEWFHLPVGAAGIGVVIFALLNYGLWTGWFWQALKRSFCNPNTTILSKRQSYWLVACYEAVILGFAMEERPGYGNASYWLLSNLSVLADFNLVLFVGLIAVLSPQRQALIDWARYRHQRASTQRGFWNRALVQDLIVGEKSPALIAIAINLVIATTPSLVWILLLPTEYLDKIKGLFDVAFFVSLMIIYASIAQLMLLMKTQKRSLWAAGTIVGLNVLPPMILQALSVSIYKNPTTPWLFSTFPWLGIEDAATTTTFMALLSEWGVLVLLNLQLTRQLRRAGESASKALFANRPSLPSS